jgi:2'-5' RNA ligase
LLNDFALVTYIPDPLARFLDDLRSELVPGFLPHAHVTVLPPRQLTAAPEAMIEAIRSHIYDFAPFEIQAGQVEVFDKTDVVFIGLAKGQDELRQMHGALNSGPLAANEPYPYHPHITLAQELTHEESVRLAGLARRRWSEYPYQRAFQVDSFAFVQSVGQNLWLDLARFELAPAPSVRR